MKYLNTKLTVCTLLISLVSASQSFAGSIQGAGALPCGEWVEQRTRGDHNMALAWVMGFMSSYNHYTYNGSKKNGTFGDINHNSIALWMDNYCKANPLESVYGGSVKLIEEMVKNNA